MPRQTKKADDKKVVVAPAPTMIPAPTAGVISQPTMPLGVNQRVVDTESFLSVRDSVIARLTTMVELLRSLTHDYVRQTNLLLGQPSAEGPGDLLSSFETAAAQLLMPGAAEMPGPVEEKKERKKRTHDPNAPKRPLTPYFLYMQHARSIIAKDLGADAPKGAVQEEGQRRWANMSPGEKKGWNTAYQYNLRLYNARVHAYKEGGNPLAKDMNPEEALAYADEFQIPMPSVKESAAQEAPANDHDAIAEQLQDEAKTPKKAAPRKRKTATPAADTTITEAAKATPASPDKKRRRTSTKPTEDKDEPKKSGRKKTKSS